MYNLYMCMQSLMLDIFFEKVINMKMRTEVMCDIQLPTSKSKCLPVYIILICLISFASAPGQNARLINPDFEEGEPGQIPGGWLIPRVILEQGFSAVITSNDPQSGKYCVEIRWPTEGTPTAPFSNLMQSIDATAWHGKRIKVTAAIRVASKTPDGRAQMWLRVDKPGGVGAFDNMHDRPVSSETWADYSITADVADDALRVNLGLITFDGATAWWDNIRIELLGEFKILTEPPRALSDMELDNLIAFTRLLGYVRHFHPSDQAAELNWLDFIVAAIPHIEAAKGPADLSAKLQSVFQSVAPTVRVFETDKEPAMPAELQPPANVSALKVRFWEYYGYSSTEKSQRSEPYSSKRLTLVVDTPEMLPDYALPENVYKSELAAGVSCMVPTALFADDQGTLPQVAAAENEELQFSISHRGGRLATVMTAWNILQHFYPYFDVIDTDWSHELKVALRKAAVDEDEAEFYQTLNRLIVALQDGHGSLGGPGRPSGQPLPLIAELMDNQAVVIAVAVDTNDIHPGDVLESIDGCPAREAFAMVGSQVSTATAQRIKQLSFSFGWKPRATEAVLELRGADGLLRKVTVVRAKKGIDTKRPPKLHEIKPGIFYVDITRLTHEEFEKALPELAKAKGLVFDVRGYPKIMPDWITHLSSKRLKSAHWYIPKAHRPDHTDMEWNTSRWNLDVGEPQLTSNRVFLTDGSAMSYAESLMGIVEAYKLGEIVGESTAGTNGNMCPVNLYLGYSMVFTGMKVLKHDGSRHHGVGILPTVPVSRTIQGIREGRDEQLEKALSLLK